MRQEPKMYKSTKPKDAAVDTDVVEAHLAEGGFHDMVNRFFHKIHAFLKWNFSADSYDSDHHKYDYDGYGYRYRYGYGYGYGYTDWHSRSDDN